MVDCLEMSIRPASGCLRLRRPAARAQDATHRLRYRCPLWFLKNNAKRGWTMGPTSPQTMDQRCCLAFDRMSAIRLLCGKCEITVEFESTIERCCVPVGWYKTYFVLFRYHKLGCYSIDANINKKGTHHFAKLSHSLAFRP